MDKLNGEYKIAEIEPSTLYSYDTLIVNCEDDTWTNLLSTIEDELDNQFSNKPWDEISLTIKCRRISKNEYEKIMETTNN